MSFFTSPKNSIRVATLPDWLDWAAGNRSSEYVVALPMIQRGFVWKPAQIIELWDTLLQGMPIGALLVSELPKDAKHTPLTQREEEEEQGGETSVPCLGLVDGQQRTLALLAGWPLPKGTQYSLRIWVDFADKPSGGEMLRLRITTRNQPFGTSRDNPDARLSLADRRKAQEESQDPKQAIQSTEPAPAKGSALADFHKTRPFSAKPSLAIDLRDLVSWWRDATGDHEEWWKVVEERLKSIEILGAKDKVWDSLKPTEQAYVNAQIAILAKGLARLCTAEIPLVRVDNSLFNTSTDDTEPPLALLFKRIGSNFTKLSNEDYVYAILKQLLPKVHDMVVELHGHRFSGDESPSVASLLTPADLVMSALRLAAAEWKPNTKAQSADPESPSKEDFHRLIRQESFLENAFLPLLEGQKMQEWFGQVLRCLEYRKDKHVADAGLPRHALPHLGRPLVQVLLRLAQFGYLASGQTEIDSPRRNDILRLVLYWWICVTDQPKASRIAYQVIGASSADTTSDLGEKIKKAIVKDSAGLELHAPWSIGARPGLKHSTDTNKVLGWLRFAAKPDDDADRLLCDFWRRWWWPWSYWHPILLWLQRGYVASNKMAGDPIASRDEDIPYDYDHILPRDHWAAGSGSGHERDTRFMDHCDIRGHANVIGDSIGNIRVWASSDNRSDGAAAPAEKLLLIAPRPQSQQTPILLRPKERHVVRKVLLDDSAIEERHVDKWFALWIKCERAKAKPQERDHRHWTLRRAKAFEIAVETRAFALYERFWQELDFAAWSATASAGNGEKTDGEM